MIQEGKVKGSSVNYDFSFHSVDLIDLTVLEGVSKSSGTESTVDVSTRHADIT